MDSLSWFLGIEIGGTKLQIAVGRGEGEPCRGFWRGDIDAAQRASRIHQQIIAGAGELLAQARLTRDQIAGVGIGFGGPVNTAHGRVVTSHQVDGWDNFPLVAWFAEHLGWPAVLHNDADTAAYAEAHFGAGRGFDPVLYVTVGSGIGGGLIVTGKIFRGSGAGAMEIGHLRPGLAPLGAPPHASVEEISSGFGIEERARKLIAESRNGTRAGAMLLELAGGDRNRVTTRMIAQAAAKGDASCREMLESATETLGWALAQAIALVNPARIVIGGGVSLIGEEQFFEPVRRACRESVFKPFAGIAEIVPAALGEEVVIHGALALARAEFQKY
ncbi:MAG: ROK family protein [Planctomycetia bacterium]|nr:ROK family protein [Planctomycetia bacterium]